MLKPCIQSFWGLTARCSALVITFVLLAGFGGMVRTALPYLAEHRRLGAEGVDVRPEIITVTETGWYFI